MNAATPFVPLAVRRYEDLIAALRRRREALGLSLNELDTRAGFYEGYAAHIESWERKHGRGLGPVSLPLILEALGLSIVLVETDAVTPGTTRPPRRLSQGELSSRKAPDFGPVRFSSTNSKLESAAALLRAARAAIGTTREEVAKHVGIHWQTLMAAERGERISDQTWARLASFYGASGVTVDISGGRLLYRPISDSREAA